MPLVGVTRPRAVSLHEGCVDLPGECVVVATLPRGVLVIDP